MKRIKWFLLACTFLLLTFFIWKNTGNAKEDAYANYTHPSQALQSFGIKSTRNVVGIQPYLEAKNYASALSFQNQLALCLSQAKQQNWLQEGTVVVFPEYIGSWLVACHEKEAVYQNAGLNKAMGLIALNNLGTFVSRYLDASEGSDKLKYALFSMKSAEMAQLYQSVFSTLARDFKVCIVAGSIVLEEPSIDHKGLLKTAKGNLYNTSLVFDTHGNIMQPLVKKIFPVNSEKIFTACGSAATTPIFQTKAGKMGLLICADSWYPEAYKNLAGRCDFVAVPSLGGADSIWTAPWNGYNGFAAPADVDKNDYQKLTEGEAWAKYSMGTRAVAAGIPQGINVFFNGKLWDMNPEGRVLVLHNKQLTVLPPSKQGRIVNLWL